MKEHIFSYSYISRDIEDYFTHVAADDRETSLKLEAKKTHLITRNARAAWRTDVFRLK